MVNKVYTVEVSVVLDSESDLFRRIQKVADRDGVTVEMVLSTLLGVGTNHTVADRISLLEKKG